MYPANIFVINEIKRLMNDGQIGEGLIIDYPSGIGNLLIYLMTFYKKETSTTSTYVSQQTNLDT